MAGSLPRQGKVSRLTIAFPDVWMKELVQAVLTYEWIARNRTKGQACYEMVMEAIDIDDYPSKVRELLGWHTEESRRQVVERLLMSTAGSENDLSDDAGDSRAGGGEGD